MANFTGDSGNNSITGTTSADTFDMSQGGNDTVFGDDGDDVITFGSTFNTNDAVRGGAGYDVLALSGSSYTGLLITSTQLLGVEQIQLAGGNSYTLATGDGVLASGKWLYVNGYALGSGDSLHFDGGAETNGHFQLAGGNGNDTLVGGAKGDWIYSSSVTTSGGNDTLTGNGGNDIFLFSGDFNNSDRVDGGPGSDIISLSGDYSAGLTIGAATITSIEQISLVDGYNYILTSNDANVGAGKTLEIDASSLTSFTLKFDGSAETDGSFKFQDGYGNDVFTGGAKADNFVEIDGGNDTLKGGAGNDTFDFLTGAFDVFDKIDGGSGVDTLILWGTDTASVNLSNLTSIEHITLYGGAFTNKLTAPDSLVAAGHRLTVDGGHLGGGGILNFDGSKETDGHFTLIGAPEDADTLTGGALGDILQGNGLGDTLKGGGGNDTYTYLTSLDSTGLAYDTIIGFDAQADKFNFLQDITGVNATIHGGTLTTANFDGNIGTAVNGHLGANHAILFEPTSGDFAGKIFLIVDGDGVAGYNGSHDYAILLQNGTHLSSLSAADFT